MNTKLYSVLLVLTFLTSALAISFIHGDTSKIQVSQAANATGQVEIDVPIADFDPAPETDPEQRAKRLLRSKRHNLRDKNLTADERAQFSLKEQKPSRNAQRPRPEFTPPAVKKD